MATLRTFSWEGRCFNGLSQNPLLNFYLVSDRHEDMIRATKGIKRLSWTTSFKIEDLEYDNEFSYATMIVPEDSKDDVRELLVAMNFIET